jgi:hypothetical protein
MVIVSKGFKSGGNYYSGLKTWTAASVYRSAVHIYHNCMEGGVCYCTENIYDFCGLQLLPVARAVYGNGF